MANKQSKKRLQMERKTSANPHTVRYNGRLYHVDESRDYSGREVIEIADSLLNEQLGIWTEHFLFEVMRIIEYQSAIRDKISDINGYVRRTKGNLYNDVEGQRVYPVDETDAGDLTKYLTELMIVAERIQTDPPPDYTSQIMSVVYGLKDLLANKDSGQRLREALSNYQSGMTATDQWLGSIKLPGRPKGSKSQVVDWLCEKVVKIYMGDFSLTQGDATDRLIDQLYDDEAKHQTYIDYIDGRWKSDPSAALWRNVNNRPHLKALIEQRNG